MPPKAAEGEAGSFVTLSENLIFAAVQAFDKAIQLNLIMPRPTTIKEMPTNFKDVPQKLMPPLPRPMSLI